MDYRFGDWRLAPSARELWNGAELQPVARRVFECLAYLIEHRARAVGRDELVAALWGRVDVADVLVSQLVARARKTIGDDAQNQRAIRTIAGFGYRWVMPLDGLDPVDVAGAVESAVPAADAAESVRTHAAAPAPARSRPRPRNALVAVGLVALAIAIACGWWRWRPIVAPAVAQGDALIVLPLEVSAARDSGWVRLGAMDLVAERLRDAGLAVPASETVLAALHAQKAGGDDAALAALLGAHVAVHGRAVQSDDGWRVELNAIDADGTQHTVMAVRPVVMEAARQASDLLLAALGHAGTATGSEDDALGERVQRVQAAILANEFDTARAILDAAPPDQHDDPRLRYQFAQIDFHAGHLAAADATFKQLLADPAGLAPALHANLLTARGMLGMRRGDCADAESHFDAALATLGDGGAALDQGKALAGRGLARSCLRRYDEAANDLGLARARMTSAGDRLGLARVDNYLGLLEIYRNRLVEAQGHFRGAADTFLAFGATDALRAVLSGLLDTQVNLLQRTDALATSERLWALRERVPDVGQRLALAADRARALAGVGRDAEAARVLGGADADLAAAAEASYARHVHAERAELAWRHGDARRAVASARQALLDWPPRPEDERRARTALTLQRASIAAGEAPGAGVSMDAASSPIAAVAAAEAAAHHGDDRTAEDAFREALARADAMGVPATTALVAVAYTDWLLARGRGHDAADVAGRTALWADRDFDCALLQVALYRALGREDLRAAALREALALAGERPIPAALRSPVGD